MREPQVRRRTVEVVSGTSDERDLPETPRTVLVVSDLHLAEGRDPHTGRYRRQENFFADAAFRRFLRYHDPGEAGPTLLVLNGDTFDFLRITASPREPDEFEQWRCQLAELGVQKTLRELIRSIHVSERDLGLETDDFKSVWKLSRISRGHREFFEALGWWVERGGWVVFVKGNRDLELHWPLVRAAVRREIGRGRPEADVARRVLFRERSLQHKNVYIEHGHRFEPFTSVRGAATLPGGRQLNLPLASAVSRFVTNTIQGLEPFLENVRPTHRVLWTIAQRHPAKIFTLLRRSLPLLTRVHNRPWSRERLGLLAFCAALLLPVVASVAMLGVALWAVAGGLGGQLPSSLLIGLATLGAGIPLAAMMLQRWRPGGRSAIGEDRFAERAYFALGRSGVPPEAARVYGVLGHTLRADVQRLPSLGPTDALYVNAGTWTPGWQADRPDLIGHVRYTFLRFDLAVNEEYQLEFLEWDDERNQPAPTVILEPQRQRDPSAALSSRERRTLQAFAEVLLDGEDDLPGPAEVAGNVERYVARRRFGQIKSLRLALFVAEYVLPLPMVRPFSRLNLPARRRAIERRLARSPRSRLTKYLARVRALILLGYYGDDRTHQRLGVSLTPDRGTTGGPVSTRGAARLKLEDPQDDELTCDTCIIGSGAGGAVVALHAAVTGEDVIVVDQRQLVYTSSRLSHQETVMLAQLHKEGGAERVLDLDGSILQGGWPGGSPVADTGVCVRPFADPDLRGPDGPDVLDRWHALGAHLDRQRLSAAFERVERRLEVDRITPEAGGENARLLLDGWIRLLAQGLGDRTFSCNLFRKSHHGKVSTLEAYLADASAHGARMIPDCRAMRIEHRAGTARAVRCRTADGRTVRIRARHIVLACGAIASSLLLRRSGIRRNVGTRVSVNPGAMILARFPQRVAGFEALQVGGFVDSGEYMLESHFLPPMAFATALPGWFTPHAQRVHGYDRFASGRVLIGTDANARVKRLRGERDWFGPIAYRMTARDLDALRRGVALLIQVYFAAGAESVYPAAVAELELTARDFAPRGRINPGKIARFVERHARRPRDLILSSSHLQGGNPMSDDPRTGVVDSNFRVHGLTNVFACDASVFPTSVRIHPRLTVMAMADYAWETSIGMGNRG